MHDERTTACPHCGGTTIAWRVRRLGNHDRPGMERELEWSCRTCDGRWTEAAGPGLEPPPGAGAGSAKHHP